MTTRATTMLAAILAAALAVSTSACGTDTTDDTGPARAAAGSTASAESPGAAQADPQDAPPSDEQLIPVIEQWAQGDDTGDGQLACSALTAERAEEERQQAQEDGDQFQSCEEMYAENPPYHPKGDLLEYDVQQRDPAVALVRAVFEGGGTGGSVYVFGLIPKDGSWLIADRDEITD